ncbi:MAG: MmcQ/YjbR family DNA-binding protein [Planctomycetes bacterium]|nr:MmcQ/YjbR family DNA-binding protein [Planctomycetota bacterium]
MARRNSLKKALAALRKHALSYLECVEDFPWGHSAFKVKGKAFLFTYLDDDKGVLSLSMKLPLSGKMALTLPFASSTRYGLGKSGWVTCLFHAGDDVPIDMLQEWIDESFRAIAPKRIVAQLESEPEA